MSKKLGTRFPAGPDELKISKNTMEKSAVVQPEKEVTTKKLEDCQPSNEVKDHTSKLDGQPNDSADTVGKDTSELECGSELNEDTIKKAIEKRAAYFRENSNSLTLEGVRRALEKDLGLKAFSLDIHKRFIKRCLEECFCGTDELTISKNTVENSAVVQPEKEGTTKKLEDCQASKEAKDHTSKLDGQLNDSADTVGTDTSELECGSDLNEDTIKKAIEKRAGYFRENSETLSLLGVRRLLEEDLKLERNTLDAFKGFISKLLDEALSSEFIEPANGIKKQPKKTTQATNVDKKIKQSKTNVKRKNDVYSDSDEIDGGDDDVDEENKKPKKRAPQNEKVNKNEVVKKQKLSNEKSKPSSSVKKKPTEVAVENSAGTEEVGNSSEDVRSQSSSEEDAKIRKETSTQVYGKRVEHLKSVIKSCGLSVSPAVYKRVKQAPESKREAALIKELEKILGREGLSANPSEKDVKTVRKKKERAKELEGIDMSNIVPTSRRRTSFNFIPPKPQIPVESDEEEDEEEDEEDTEDDNSDNGVSSKGSGEDDGDESE